MSIGYTRRRTEAVRLRLAATLRSDDTAETRAENVLAMMGATLHDPAEREIVRQGIVEVLTDYMLLDTVARGARIPDSAYDGAKDSHDCYYAAIAAIRKQRESDVR